MSMQLGDQLGQDWDINSSWRLLDGSSIKAAFEILGLPLALQTFYHFLHRLRTRLTGIRSELCREQPPPANSQTDPLCQTVEHLRRLFPKGDCPLTDFQLHFQRPLLAPD